jgi:hypothetical protein
MNGPVSFGGALSQVRFGIAGPSGRTYPSGMFPDPWSWTHGAAMWPRSPLCQPIQQCCCKLWTLAPGNRQPLLMDWTQWLTSVPGYGLNAVESATLWDVGKAPPVVADPAKIKIVSGTDDDETPDNDDAALFVSLIPPCAAQVLVEAAPNVPLGQQFKFDICIIARDCDGRRLRKCDCVVITMQEC